MLCGEGLEGDKQVEGRVGFEKLSITEGGKEGEIQVIASCSYE